MRSAALLAAASLAIGAVAARADSPPPFHYDTKNCENSYYLMPTTASRGRAEVPSRFGVLGEPLGIAIAGALFTTCDISINGGAFQRASWSDVGVLIDPPDSPVNDAAIHIYRAWNASELAEMVALNLAWGIESSAAEVSTAFAPGLPLATTVGFVDGPYGKYGGEGVWEGDDHPGAPGVVTWWSVGPRGVVRFDQAYTNDHEQCGVGVVTGEGRAGALIGGTGIAPHGCVVFADLIGDAKLVEPAP